jgi:nucleotide-binding universal stress UspA family protein
MEPKTSTTKALKHFTPVKMKRVLIALDFDPSAEKVAESGYSLAKSMKAEVYLVHVMGGLNYYTTLEYSPIMGYSGFSTSGAAPGMIDIDRIREASENFLNESKKHLGDESIQAIVTDGDAADEIIRTAESISADVIVVGTHSRRGLEKMLMGSVAEKVFHHTSIPLFIIPTKKTRE